MATICNSAVGINKEAKKRFSVNIQVCTLHTCINDIHIQGGKKKKDIPVGPLQYLNIRKHLLIETLLCTCVQNNTSDSVRRQKRWFDICYSQHLLVLPSIIWPWNTEWSRAKANRVLQRECTDQSKHPLPTTQETTLHNDVTKWSIPKSDWLHSLQPKMEKLYTVSKNETGSWWWLRSWTPYCQIQA